MAEVLPVLSRRSPSRGITRLEAEVTLEMARSEATATLEVVKAETLGSIAQAGMAEVARLSAAELALAEQHPYAFNRLRHIGDVAAVEIAERVRHANRSLG